MDKRTLIGFVLIALVMVVFMMMNQPSAEQIKAREHYNDSIAQVARQQQNERLIAEQQEQDSIAILQKDSSSVYFRASEGIDSIITLQNDLLSVRLSTIGGRICSATLANFNNQDGEPITLFNEEDKLNIGQTDRHRSIRSPQTAGNEFYFTFDGKNENINTQDLYFTPQAITDSSVTMRLQVTESGYIDFIYRLISGSYLVDFEIQAHNLQNFFSSATNSMGITWNQLVRQQEKGFSFEQRYTTLTYKTNGDNDTDYLTEMKKDSEKLEKPVDWIDFKNQFFSCIFISDDNFNNVSIASNPFNEGNGYMKDMSAQMTAPFYPDGDTPSRFQFYFGPNHYSTLVTNGKLAESQLGVNKKLELNKLIYFGWPIIRWINRFFTLYLFDWLSQWGLNMGIVLLLLTLIVKALVYPFTYKSYMSSAKMRALKPYIDEISKKYPNKEDALKKQQETMTLYSKFGANPMGGCLPMLIQMPIWFALFSFVPNAIELRQESFLWASDLSSYDNLIHWSGSIPLLGSHISLFCLLFSAANIINTIYSMKQQPAVSGEQAQQMKMMRWMMYIMPIVFIFVLNDYSSGLNYYYFISALISILTFVYLRKSVDEKALLKKLEAYYEANKDKPAKKSNMMAKMEALQKEQERRNAELQKKIKK